MRLPRVLNAIRDFIRREPPTALTEALFLRLLGAIYLISFASFWPQIVGLVGSKGVSPASELIRAVTIQYGSIPWMQFPTLFLFGVTDHALVAFCVLGCVAALPLALGFLSRIAAAACWILYLSIAVVGQPFSNFQWDALLLESGFLALFAGSPLLVYAYRLLLFRLMFESGVVKLSSHDPNWANFHALRYHFFTQPLPTPLAYYAARLPGFMLDGMTAATLAIELFLPFLLFAPKIYRQVAVGFFALLQIIILLTGNYAFFNLLTLSLCLWGLDDASLPPFRLRLKPIQLKREWMRWSTSLLLLILMFAGCVEAYAAVFPSEEYLTVLIREFAAPFEIVNNYGLFAVMTTTRPEIVLEGSNDRQQWREYTFRYKPGAVNRGLPLVAPYQPRLDWQMWFAALGSSRQDYWVRVLMLRLLLGEPSVLSLLEPPPFAKPPQYMRALLYEYTFTTPQERRRTGAVWRRRLVGLWGGPFSVSAR
jgi:hypothetical protein